MNTIDIAGKSFTIKGELPNGAFYLEGPRGGSALFAKTIDGNVFTFHAVKGGAVSYNQGVLVTATREQLAA